METFKKAIAEIGQLVNVGESCWNCAFVWVLKKDTSLKSLIVCVKEEM